jgi:hypothetical protein
VTRKTQLGVTAAGATIGLALLTALWVAHDPAAPPDETPSHARSNESPSTHPSSASEPVDPQALAEVREAFQGVLAGDSPPGMVEMMRGPRRGQTGAPAELPPLPDPLVMPAGYSPPSSSSADLPPLPPLPGESSAKPELLPPPQETPAAEKSPKEGAAPSDLPPLPPP